jgi:hypothetical protein
MAPTKLEAELLDDFEIGPVEIASISEPRSETVLTVRRLPRPSMELSGLDLSVLLQTFRSAINDQTKNPGQATQDTTVSHLTALGMLNPKNI